MFVGILAGIAAGALWGLTFLVPNLVPAFSAAELTLARYAIYGLSSLAWLAAAGLAPLRRLGRRDWRRLILFGLTGNVLYYVLAAQAVRLAGTAVTALIIGTLPVIMALVGNRSRTIPPAALAPSLAMIAAGLLLTNAPALLAAEAGGSAAATAAGIACATLALLSWLYYGLANAAYMTSKGGFPPMAWTALLGVGTLAGLPPLLAAAALTAERPLFLDRTAEELAGLLLWATVLGIAASWLATWLWNIASQRLPVPLLGQLVAAETLFALFYGFAWEGRPPAAAEAAAAALILGGVVWAMEAARRARRKR